MFCWKCGKENPQGSAFCVYCGSSLNDDPAKMHADIPETSALDAEPVSSRPQSAAQDSGTDEEGTTILGTDENYTFSPGSGTGGSSYAGQNAGSTSYSSQNTESTSYSSQDTESTFYSAQGGYSNNTSYSAQEGYLGGSQRDVPPAPYPNDGGKKKTPWIFIVLIAIMVAAVIVIVVAMVKERGSNNSSQEDAVVTETTEDTAESTAEDTTESTEETSSDSGLPVLTESATSRGLYGEGTNDNLPGLTVTASIPASEDLGDGDVLILTFTNTSETDYVLGGSGTYYVALIAKDGQRYDCNGIEAVTVPAGGGSISQSYDISQAEGLFDSVYISPIYTVDSYEGDGNGIGVGLSLTMLDETGKKAQ